MPHLHLPTDHTDADLVLAANLADIVGSEDLYVAWSQETGAGMPEIEAYVSEEPPASSWVSTSPSTAAWVAPPRGPRPSRRCAPSGSAS